MGHILVGTAGWSYPDWRGIIYPVRAPHGFDALHYLAAYLDVIEINSTFYRPPEPRHAERWVEATDGIEGFRFTAKLYRGFTHVAPEDWRDDEVAAFRAGIEPLVAADRLGAVLIQFPFFFTASPRTYDHLERIAATFPELPLVVEVRHRSFLAPAALEWLARRRLSFCNIDQPLARNSIEPGARVTGPLGYFRMHGRNRTAWFSRTAGRDEKYDYLYSPEELRSFLPFIEAIAARTDDAYVITNNHYLGQGPANALELKHLLTGAPVEVPPLLTGRYPRLARIAAG